MRWTLDYSPGAVSDLYQRVERQHARDITTIIQALAEKPTPENMQVAEDDPSVFWVPAPGDHVIRYEIIDERRVVHIIRIE